MPRNGGGVKAAAKTRARVRESAPPPLVKARDKSLEALLLNGNGPDHARVNIKPPNMKSATFRIIGESALLQARFSEKTRTILLEKMAADESPTKKRAPRKGRDYDNEMKEALHRSVDGWYGIPASAFRNACISACRISGFKMTHAKLSIFCVADGYDADGMPLVKLDGNKFQRSLLPVRNSNGNVDLRSRPMWPQWSCYITLRFDGDQFSEIDVANLLSRAGQQVGIGEGRPDSKESNGLGFGLFRLASDADKA